MTTAVRISPLGIFCFVCLGFILLYTLKNVVMSDSVPAVEPNFAPVVGRSYVQVKRLLETSIYLAEKGGKVLKEIREKSDLHVCIADIIKKSYCMNIDMSTFTYTCFLIAAILFIFN